MLSQRKRRYRCSSTRNLRKESTRMMRGSKRKSKKKRRSLSSIMSTSILA
jgi:hypothetical protein